MERADNPLSEHDNTPLMAKAYDHRSVEERLYRWWMAQGFFTPRIHPSKQPFTIVIPPPNVTGELHHGHAMFVAFQDLMIRWRRMRGCAALWLPGTDHAGIATQAVVERELAKQGLSRHQLGREQFVARVWEWKEKYGNIITHQMKRLGASCDWSRERFTLDEGLSRAVRETFVRLYKKDLIYRGKYLINWCPRCATALSDLEVEHEPTHGKLYYVEYPVEGNGSTRITVATTRPETILGDTAVAVHPDDARYRHLVGRLIVLPVIGRRIRVIADEAVDVSFGTGAVKVTPAHDPADYEIGRRHNLPSISVIDQNATMNAEAGPYAGLTREECRRRLVDDLRRDGLLLKVEEIEHAVGHCQRCDTVVEPLISEQWFVRIQPLAVPAVEAVRDGTIRIIPDRFAKVYFNWMENIRDWCISRQLWWGHRIPVWYCESCGHATVSVATPRTCESCGGARLRQDEDVLDTWFSSGLWPFSTLGWPEQTEDYRYFYPTSVMETGYDILFFWVARMIMLGLECTQQAPFHTVYLHGLMRDEKGDKISKSKGNVANPIEVIDRFGADALRFTIVTGSSPGNDMKLSEEKLLASRNFANKLWNIARVASLNTPGYLAADIQGRGHVLPPPSQLELSDRWIVSRSSTVAAAVTDLLADYQFGEAGRALYDFVWSELADWYVEIAKIRLYGADDAAKDNVRRVLLYAIERSLRLLHPLMPFVTEEIWQLLPHQGQALMIAAWPLADRIDAGVEAQMGRLMELVRTINRARAEFKVEAGKDIEAIVVAGDQVDLVAAHKDVFARLAHARPLTVVVNLPAPPKRAFHGISGGVEVYLPLAGMIDLSAEQARLSRELSAVREQIDRTERRLVDTKFVDQAPEAVVGREREKLARLHDTLAKLEERSRLVSE